ncbi:hypothetical protein [Chryseobacterium kwangjuense]|uniref:Sugar-binding protein n=1 Tax=Chryseobacterium kwangjuense TaxID=267125 RepID=A0A135W8V1_9FLAO|nr:hypothetical protein [Chryseobacterium kwangjuense]KXH81152.1 hypothetical protein AU378_15630 [Chryseobacterium kwangjuense]
MKKILIPAALLIISFMKAQQSTTNASLPKIIPPSPTAYSLGNYGNVPIGLFTGAPNISVPLFTYQTGNINLPLSLSYSSNGVRVDELSTNVGLGWNLNFGGVITRMVRDRADESSTHITTPETISGAYTNPVTNQFLSAVGNGSDALDTEADLYSFNFNGYSGKFFYDQNNQPHIVDQQAIKIERIGNTNGDGQDFVLTVANGEKYHFTEKESTMYRSVGGGHSIPSGAVTAWYLTKIQHPNGDEVNFIYEASTLAEYTTSQSQTLRMSVGYPGTQAMCQGSGYSLGPSKGAIVSNTMQVSGKRILSISSNNLADGTVTFEYETGNSALDVDGNVKIKTIKLLGRNGETIESASLTYLNTTNKRNFLSSITFKDPQKKYSFDYDNPQDLPERLSKSQDHWGYYNRANNSDLVPKNIPDYGLSKINYGGADKEPNPLYSKLGMLNKITYPTKGYTELEYEGNTYWGEKTILPTLFTEHLDVDTDTQTDERTVEYTIVSVMDQPITINAVLSANSIQLCESFAGSGHYAGSVQVNQGTIYHLTRDSRTKNISFNAVAGGTYTIKLKADFMCSNVSASVSYFQTAPQTFFTNLDTGGVRVKSTKDVDPVSGIPVYKRYHYAHKDDISKSSGQKGNRTYYTDMAKWQTACNGAPGSGNPGSCASVVENSDIILSSSSLMPLYDTGTMSCLYPFVTISEGGDNFENGGEMKEFTIRRDSPGSNVWGPGGISNNPWTNKGWDNGTEIKSFVLRKNSGSSALDIIQAKENIYEKNDSATFELKNFSGKNLFDYACGTPQHPYTCTAVDVGMPNNKCTGKAVNETVYLADLDNLSINEYRSISYWHYLKSQKTTDYLDGIPVKTETEYFYNNPSHYQLSRQKTTYSDNRISETAYSYAHEKGNQLMISKNMVGVPLETISSKTVNGTTRTVTKTETLYPAALPTAETGSLILPQSVKLYDTPNNTVSTELKYDKYDASGNLLQYTEKTGAPVTFVWGYGGTQPIAQIEGITYDQLSGLGLISAIVTASDQDASNPDLEPALITALDTFRNHTALKGYKVTTFTYDLLKGVTSITPPSGIREIYIYDVYGRLKEIRENDKNGNILKEYKYNFKP